MTIESPAVSATTANPWRHDGTTPFAEANTLISAATWQPFTTTDVVVHRSRTVRPIECIECEADPNPQEWGLAPLNPQPHMDRWSNERMVLPPQRVLDARGGLRLPYSSGGPNDLAAPPNSASVENGNEEATLFYLGSYSGHIAREVSRQINVASNRWLLSKLEDLRSSGDSYVYPGGRRPSETAFRDAGLFILKLPTLSMYPKVALVADGEINFLWKHGTVHVDLGFYGDGEGSYYARDKNGSEYFCDGFPASKGLPAEIASLFEVE